MFNVSLMSLSAFPIFDWITWSPYQHSYLASSYMPNRYKSNLFLSVKWPSRASMTLGRFYVIFIMLRVIPSSLLLVVQHWKDIEAIFVTLDFLGPWNARQLKQYMNVPLQVLTQRISPKLYQFRLKVDHVYHTGMSKP